MPCATALRSKKQKPAGATEWKSVADVFGFPGDVLADGVIRFNMPRKDLHVTIDGIEIKPGLALGAWAATISLCATGRIT